MGPQHNAPAVVQPTPAPMAPEPPASAPPVEPIQIPPAPTNPNVPVGNPGQVPPSAPPNTPNLPQPNQPQQTNMPTDPPVDPNADPQQATPPAGDIPIIRMADGTEVPLDDYKVKLPSGQEMSYNDMVQQQGDVDRQVQAIQTEQERLAKWEQATQALLQGGQAPQQAGPTQQVPQGTPQYQPMGITQSGPPTAPTNGQFQPVIQQQQQAQQFGYLDPSQLGDMATENEIRIANHSNQQTEGMNQYLQQQTQQMTDMQQMIKTQQEITENQMLNAELSRVSDQYGVTQDDLWNEAKQTGVHNLDVLGQNLQLKSQMNTQQSQQNQQNAQQASQSVGTGPSTHSPTQPTQSAVVGRGVTDYNNADQVMAAYNII